MSKMKSMDSAPKDGTHILVYGHFAAEGYGTDDEGPSFAVVEWTGHRSDYPGYDWDVVNSGLMKVWCKPISWQHLPKL